ncbi:hypothetical protein P775_17540 [Puniceibacterium antarcticum]|uniref:Uncharacterized protein n=1 Tax=Puniceibacterium antarcticum TaxID=1206336 RepID=A0A2G8RBA3_9RHOB|nr:hypothetical protein [Puniceibacterium antarcticum]PIL18846.1 hypothetical protein P775_17540 [Puniceibacterium antarcticum]
MRRWLYRLFLVAQMIAFLAGVVWFWQTSPFADPITERGESELRQALDRAMAREVDQDWLDRRLAQALEQDDLDRAALLIEVGSERMPPVLPLPEMQAEYERKAEIAGRPLAEAKACLRCAVDATSCKSISLIATCLIPFEMTPAGDINALRTEAWAAFSGGEVDELNAGLAVVGLGATALILFTGPVSGTAKVGATTLRIGRKLGSLTTRMGGELSKMSRLDIKAGGLWRWSYGTGPLDEALDVARLGRLERVSGSMTTVAKNTSAAEALVLLRHIESAEDAARLARVATAAGKDTRKYFTVLGKTRVFRALVRISNAALTGAALIYAAALHVLTGLAHFIGVRLLRGGARLLRPL